MAENETSDKNIGDQYSMFFSHVNMLIDRRQNITTIYLSVNTAVLGIIAFIFQNQGAHPLDWTKHIPTIGFCLAGLVACDLWRRSIKQYRALLDWWYSQLRALESGFDEKLRLLTKEFEELYKAERENKPATTRIGLSRYEIRLTWLFSTIYLVFGISILSGMFV
ncbi:MAG: hypothetical protein H6657_32495 [Ardenticatenaceae bacterium]|nr:hypothetical protein [Ardenticatenaceae bacterium]